MKNIGTAAVLIGALLTIPPIGIASTRAASLPSKEATSKHSAASTHATKGIVKSVDDKKLVVARSARSGREMTFVLNPSTEREGNVTVGSTVEVRYRTEKKQRVATVVSVQTHQASAGKGSSQR
jgi:hypothetical protein